MTDQPSDGDNFTEHPSAEQLLEQFEKLCRRGNITDLDRFLQLHRGQPARIHEEFDRIARKYKIDLAKRSSQNAASEPSQVEATIAVRAATAEHTSRYVILRPHARGGLGQVSIALDSELNRQVALKEILPNHADDRIRQERFIQEAEITGQLEHPGIVPVYGMGTYPDGRPYYAMRFVEGSSLRKAIDDLHQGAGRGASLASGERGVQFRHLLNSFIAVCHAMHYAHCRQVLHRDLKPDNIMLGPYGETLIVDWGLAKPVQTTASDSLPFPSDHGSGSGSQPVRVKGRDSNSATLEGAAVGTPAYMSPEQAEGKLSRLGPASDIYSLGATLYALLTGQPPFKDDDPFNLLAAVREGRFTRPRQLNHAVPKSLDAICVKAMALKPQDRYATARDLADDIERYLADEPVAAMPETAWSRVGRWMRRNRSVVRYAALSLLIVTAVSIIAAISNNRLRREAQQQERIARDERARAMQLAEENDRIAKENLALAESERRKSEEATRLAAERQELADAMSRLAAEERDQRITAEKLVEFLTGLFYAADPIGMNVDFFIPKANSEALTASEILKRGAERVTTDAALAQSPLAKAQILNTIGDVNRQLGRFKEAEPLLQEALQIRRQILGDEHEITAQSFHSLGAYYHERGDYEKANELYRRAIAVREKLPGVEGRKALAASLHNLAWMMANEGDAAGAEKLFREVLELKRSIYGDLHRETAFSKMGVAFSLIEQQRMLEVAPYVIAFKSDFQRLEGAGDLVDGVTNFATALAAQQLAGPAAAEPGFRSALEAIKRGLGDDNVYTALVHCELGGCLQRQRKFDEAEQHFRRSFEIARDKVQLQHPRICLLLDRYSRLLHDQGKTDEGVAIWREFIAAQEHRFEHRHRYVAEALYEFAAFLRYARRYDESSAQWEAFLEIADAVRKGEDTYTRDMAYFFIGRNHLQKQPPDPAKSEAAFRASIEAVKAAPRPGTDLANELAITQLYLAQAIILQNRIDDAEAILAEADANARGIVTPSDQNDYRDRRNEVRLALAERSGAPEKVEAVYREWIAEREKQHGATAEPTLKAKEDLARHFEKQGKRPEAIELRQAILVARESRLPAGDQLILTGRERLASLYLESGDADKAASLLEQNHQTLLKIAPPTDPALQNAATKLAVVLLRTSRREEALPLLEQVHARRVQQLGAEHDQSIDALARLTLTQQTLGKGNAEAPPWRVFLQALAPLDAERGAAIKTAYARELIQLEQSAPAAEVLREVVAYRQSQTPDDWRTAIARSLLGDALLRLQQTEEAEPHLRDAWRILEPRFSDLPDATRPHALEALERLIRLEETLNRPDQATQLREKLNSLRPAK